MKIGLLSDTHAKTELARDAINTLIQRGVSWLIHAGDVGNEEILKLLKDSSLPYVSVFGNNDFHLQSLQTRYDIFKEPHYFKIENLTCKLMHLPFFLAPDADIIICGHTHEFEAKLQNGKLFVNPGECCARNKPFSEYALLEITNDKFGLTHFQKDINTENLTTEVYTFDRI